MDIADIDWMDRLSSSELPAQRIDSRAKLIITVLYAAIVMSFGKYDILPLVGFAAFPVFMVVSGGVPVGKLLRRLLPACGFAVMVGIFNPFIDREILVRIGDVGISGGWISFLSIFIRVVLTASAALVLLAVTGIYKICQAMESLKVPKIFVVQILFLHRYIFVLAEEILRLKTSVGARSFSAGKNAVSMKNFGHIAGSMLIRSIDRAQRIYTAMKSRGFDGALHLSSSGRWAKRDSAFVIAWAGVFVVLRIAGGGF